MPEGGEAAALRPQVSQGLGMGVDPPAAGARDQAEIGGGEAREQAAEPLMPQARGTASGNSPASPASLAGQTPRSVIRPVT